MPRTNSRQGGAAPIGPDTKAIRNAVRVLSGSPLVRTARLGQTREGVWRIEYSEPQAPGLGWRSKTLSCRTTDQAKAQRFLDDWLRMAVEEERGAGAAAVPRPTIEELCRVYVAAKPVQRLVLAPVRRILGALRVEDIGLDTPRQYRTLRAHVTGGSIRRELGALLATLNYGKRHRLLAGEVPVIDLPPENPPRSAYLSRDQATMLWDEAREQAQRAGTVWTRRVWIFVALAMETAARHGAICELSWDRVDLELRTIDYRNPLQPANRKRRVVVPVSDRLLPVLQEAALRARRDSSGRPVGRVLGDGSTHVGTHFRALARGLGMPWLTPHVLRHTWASQAAIDGVPLFHVAKMLGNSVLVVERTYAKLAPSDLMGVVNRAGRAA